MGDTRNRLIKIFGAENVIENPEFDSSSVGFKAMGKELAPDFRVLASSTDQVQALVKLARELSLPLVPVSSAGPHRSGGVKPAIPGAVIVDLSGMKKILYVDRRTRLALIEPGVTWEELSAELAVHGLRIMAPLLPRKGKSVIASLLDREPLASPKYQWNMTEPLRSMEIIWGTGDKIYSGMGGHRGEKKEAWETGTIPMTNAGPHQFDFIKMLTASQGTFGIVTWASVKVEVAAKVEKPLFFQGSSLEELNDFLYKILRYRFGDEVCIFNRKALSSILAESPGEIREYDARLAPWSALVNVKWGALRAEEKVAGQTADIMDIGQEYGLLAQPSVADLPAVRVARRILALDGGNDWKTRAADTAKEIFFLSTLDRIPPQLYRAAEVGDQFGFPLTDCPVYIQPLHQGTAAHCHIVLPVPPEQEDSGEYRAFYDEMCRQLAAAGAFFSRPYDLWSDIVYSGNAEHTVLTRKMKDIFDPANIMNPGKLCF